MVTEKEAEQHRAAIATLLGTQQVRCTWDEYDDHEFKVQSADGGPLKQATVDIDEFPDNCGTFVIHGFPEDSWARKDRLEMLRHLIPLAMWEMRKHNGMVVATTNKYQMQMGAVLAEVGFVPTGFYNANSENNCTFWHYVLHKPRLPKKVQIE